MKGLRTRDGIEAELLRLVLAGRAEQRCSSCGLAEAAGAYCTRCLTRSLPRRDWFDGGRTPLPRPSRGELEALVEDFDGPGLEEF
jgi:hypothetical protein